MTSHQEIAFRNFIHFWLYLMEGCFVSKWVLPRNQLTKDCTDSPLTILLSLIDRAAALPTDKLIENRRWEVV